jgi:imidazolonepropionase-like amidohydrolase
VVDLGDATVLPGLIDAHTHLLLRFVGALGDENTNLVVTFNTVEPAGRALVGAAMAREMLEAGFTTVRDLGNSGHNGDVALRDAIRAGWVPGPRMIVSTRAIAPPGGQFGKLAALGRALVAEEYAEVTGADAARRAVREAVFDGASVIKVIVDASAVSLSAAELDAIVDEAHRARVKVAAHAVGDDAVRAAVRAGVDSIEHAYSAPDDALRTMAEKKIFLVPTDHPPDANESEEFVAAERKRLARAVALGVPIAAGSDIYWAQTGRTRGESAKQVLRAYAATGMTAAQILRAATIDAARLLGVDREVGSLEAGKYADLLVVAGDPLADIGALYQVRMVMKGGIAVARGASPTSPIPPR